MSKTSPKRPTKKNDPGRNRTIIRDEARDSFRDWAPSGWSTTPEYQQAQAIWDAAEAELRAAEDAWKKAKGGRPSEAKRAKAAVIAARAKAGVAQEKLAKLGGANDNLTRDGSGDIQSLEALFNEKTAFEDAAPDQRSVDGQYDVMDQLGEIYKKGGYTSAEMAGIRNARTQADQYEQQQRQAVDQSLARRGMAGGGMAAMARLMAQQGGADRLAQSANQTALAGTDRATQALFGKGTMATNVRNQSYNEAAQLAAARDRNTAENLRRQEATDIWNAQLASRNEQIAYANRMGHAAANSAALFQGLGTKGNDSLGDKIGKTTQAIGQILDPLGLVSSAGSSISGAVGGGGGGGGAVDGGGMSGSQGGASAKMSSDGVGFGTQTNALNYTPAAKG